MEGTGLVQRRMIPNTWAAIAARHRSLVVLGSLLTTFAGLALLIDRDGKVAVSHTGVVDKDNFESHIQDLLK